MKITWRGQFNSSSAIPLINRKLSAALRQWGVEVHENMHNIGTELTPVLVSHTYPPSMPNIRHAFNVLLVHWEFRGAAGVPQYFIDVFKDYDLVLASSAWTSDQFKQVTSTPVSHIHLGADEQEFSVTGEATDWGKLNDKLDNAKKVILWVGGTDDRHGLDIALDVLDLLPDDHYLVAKYSVHYPPPRRALEHPRAVILRQEFDSLAPLYRAADVLLQSARGVGFCLPVLEARFCGLPVASTPLPPVREFADDGAYFSIGTWRYYHNHPVHTDCLPEWLEPDIESLAAAVRNALTKGKKGQVNEAWRLQHTWPVVAQQLLERIKQYAAEPVIA